MRKLMMAMGASMLVAAPAVSADILGVGATFGYWDADYSGTASKDNDQVDLERDLNLSGDSNANLTAYFEHPVPVLPNVRLAYTRTEQSGNGQIPTGYDNVFGDVRSELELEQLDVTLYYEILDNWVNLDLGLTVRDFSGELLVQSRTIPGQSSKTEADAVLPLLYVAARFDLPFTGASVGGDANAISYDGDSVYDFNVYGQYELSLLQLRAGYRQIALDYEDGDDNLDIELSGPFISAGLRF